MSHLLTVIIPCFNSERTLKQAVDSIFSQNLPFTFEIVIVDDKSTDSTQALIKDLALEHPEIQFIFHVQNQGGGAARNTAIQHAKGKLIFCLDSDDLLGENMLAPMVSMLEEKKLDAVGIHISKKFIGSNTEHISYITTFNHVNKIIPFESFFEEGVCALNSTFLHTKKAFEVCGGYPTEHGFDTQGYAFRFLANGLKASVCENATYLHRVNFTRSYFFREYEQGKLSENFMKIYEEFFYLFSESMQRRLLSADLTDINLSLPQILTNEKNKFAKNYKELVQPYTQINYEKKLKSKDISPVDAYWLGCRCLQRREYESAMVWFSRAFKVGVTSVRLNQQFLIAIQNATGVSGETLLNDTLKKRHFKKKIQLFTLQKRNDLVRVVRQFI